MAKKKPKNTKVLPAEWKAKKIENKLVQKIDDSPSVAKETGSIKQDFNRIQEIEHLDGYGFRVYIMPTPKDPRIYADMTYEEAMGRVIAMHRMLPLVPLVDRRSFVEQVTFLRSRLYEAMTKDDIEAFDAKLEDIDEK